LIFNRIEPFTFGLILVKPILSLTGSLGGFFCDLAGKDFMKELFINLGLT
jgi:hypothetical protein